MVNKIIGWTMIVLNILMVLYALTSTTQESPLFVGLVFLLETYVSIKFVEGLKKKK